MRLPVLSWLSDSLRRVGGLLTAVAPVVFGLLPGVGLLSVLASWGWFTVRVTLPPPAPVMASPWWVAAARDGDGSACQWSLRVHEDVGSQAVSDARVTLDRLADGEVVERIVARTNAAGVFRAIDLAPGLWNATVAVDGHALQGAPDFRCAGPGQRAYFDLPIRPATHVVAGRVLGDDGRALPRATIALWQEDRHRTGIAGVVRVDVDADGRFLIALPPGRYVAWAAAPDHVARRVPLSVRAAHTTFATRLAFRPTVRGVVVDESGRPVAGAVVAMGEAWDPSSQAARVVTDAAGVFALPVVRGQELTLTAHGDGRLGRISAGTVDDVSGLQALTIAVRTGRTVVGVVVGDDGQPRPHGSVRFRVRALGLEGEVPCDGNGRFVLDGMPAEDVEAWAADNATGAWGARVADALTGHLTLPWTPPAY